MLHKQRKPTIALALVLSYCATQGQVSQPNNTVLLATDYVGCDGISNQNLRFTTFLNFNHEWRTNNIWRMRLMGDNFVGNINGYPALDLSGFLGLGNFTAGLVPQPFAMLHIDDGGFQDSGYRPWMRQGTLITHLSDQSYFGMKDEGFAVDHTVIAWSDNTPGVGGPDLLKFIFNRNNAGGTIEKAPRLPRGFFVRVVHDFAHHGQANTSSGRKWGSAPRTNRTLVACTR